MCSTLHVAWEDTAERLNNIPIAGERIRYAATVKPLLSLPRGTHILEAGCGSGRVLRALAAIGYQNLVGLEISHARLRKVAELEPPAALLVCSNEVPFLSHTFGAVVSSGVIEHVLEPEKWFAELVRVTKPGGLLSIVTDTYMWRVLKQLGLYRSIQPLDNALWPSTLIGYGRSAGLRLLGCGGFVNVLEQKAYFAKQLLRLIPFTRWLRCRLNRSRDIPVPSDETESILEAVSEFPLKHGTSRWSCLWSYECYYWFQKP